MRSIKRRQALKDLVIAVSLANLCFIDAWTELLVRTTHLGVQYSMFMFSKYVAAVSNVLLLSAILSGLILLIRRSGNGILLGAGKVGFTIALLLCLNRLIYNPFPLLSIEATLSRFNYTELAVPACACAVLMNGTIRRWRYTPFLASGLVLFALLGRVPLLIATVVTAVAFWLVKKPRAVLHAPPAIAMALFPFALMTLSQATWSLTKFGDKRPAAAIERNDRDARRVVWLLFDELDFRLSYLRRPADLSLPEFDRLRDQSVFASNAYPPSVSTLMSVPAMTTGRLVSAARAINPSEVMVTFADSGETVPWSRQPNLFSKLREAGFNTAVVGWYHPYCRIIGDSITECSFEHNGRLTIAEAMTEQIGKLGNLIPFAHKRDLFRLKAREARFLRQRHLRDYLNVMERARRAVVAPEMSLTLIHLPVPHFPAIYDRRSGRFELDAPSSYLDNLALADRALGELRQTIEAAGMWEGTTLIVTSDHWWRFLVEDSPEEKAYAKEDDHRVPFLIKLAGHREAVTFEPEFNTVIVHDLVLELLNARLKDPHSLIDWLNHNGSRAEPFHDNLSEGGTTSHGLCHLSRDPGPETE